MSYNHIEDTRSTKRRRVDDITTTTNAKSKNLTWFITHASSAIMENEQVNLFHPLYAKLPAELVLDIVDFVLEGISDEKERALSMMTLQLVCRRFKEVTDARPSLWTYLDFRMDLGQLLVRLRRNANTPLSLRLVACRKQLMDLQFRMKCLLIRKHCSRITNATVEVFIDEDTAGFIDRRKIFYLKDWQWDTVRNIHFDAAVIGDVLDLRTLEWRTPMLKHLSCGPLPDSAAYAFSAPLQRLVFRPEWAYDGRTVLRLLSSVGSSLEEIIFDFSESPGVFLDEGDEDSEDIEDLRDVKQLPRLDHVRVVLLDETSDVALFKVLNHFDLSNVLRIEIETFAGFRNELGDEGGHLFDRLLKQKPSRGVFEYTWSERLASVGDENLGVVSKDLYLRTVTRDVIR